MHGSTEPLIQSPPDTRGLPLLNEHLTRPAHRYFGGDYPLSGSLSEVRMPQGHGQGVALALLGFRKCEDRNGHRGVWDAVQRQPKRYFWDSLDRAVEQALTFFPMIGLYPVGDVTSLPDFLGHTVLEVGPPVVAEWVARVVARYQDRVALFPLFNRLNTLSAHARQRNAHAGFGLAQKRHIAELLTASVAAVQATAGDKAVSLLAAGTFVEWSRSSFQWTDGDRLLALPRGSLLRDGPLSPPDLLRLGAILDAAHGGCHADTALRQLLHQLVFWNADDSGAGNSVGRDLHRLVAEEWIYDRTLNPAGFVHTVLAGWDAQAQQTYCALSERIAPDRYVPGLDLCLHRQYESFDAFTRDRSVPNVYRERVRGFLLGDISVLASPTPPAEATAAVKAEAAPPLAQAFAEISARTAGPTRSALHAMPSLPTLPS